MFRHKATNIRTRYYLVALAGLAAFFTTTDACADRQRQQFKYTAVQAVNQKRSYNLKPNGYIINCPTVYDDFVLEPFNIRHPHDDIGPVFKLALEELNFLPGVLFFWKLTEEKIEGLSDKLRLKGEFPISKAGFYGGNTRLQNGQLKIPARIPRKADNSVSVLSLVIPDRLKWKLGIDLNAMTVYGKLNLNPYLNINSEFGDTSQAGLYFKYAF